jgi:hypothetical protein
MKKKESGLPRPTYIPTDIWLVQRDDAHLFGSESVEARESLAVRIAAGNIRAELLRRRAERIVVVLPHLDPISSHESADQVIERTPSVVDEIAVDRAKFGVELESPAVVDDLPLPLKRIVLVPKFEAHFNIGGDQLVQAFKVFGCPVDFGPNAGEIQIGHGLPLEEDDKETEGRTNTGNARGSGDTDSDPQGRVR